MKLLIITILTLGLLACNNSTDKESVESETKQDILVQSDSLVHIDSLYIDESEINSNEYKEFKE